MLIHFLDGTITYGREEPERNTCKYLLSARFSDGVTKSLTIRELNQLQRRYGWEIDVEHLPFQGACLRVHIIANGAESAFKQACDLARTLYVLFDGLTLNIAQAMAT